MAHKFQPVSNATAQGLTKEIYAESDGPSFLLLVAPDYDADSTFRAFDVDQGEFIMVHGWLYAIECAAGSVMMGA